MAKNQEILYRVQVGGIFLDLHTKAPLVFLINPKETIYIPIWIGFIEASAIYYYLKNFMTPRPFTVEVLYNIMRRDLKCEISRVVISDIAGGTYFADLVYKDKAGKEYVRDLRPSDAIGLALKAKAPIYMVKKIVDSFSASHREEFKKLYLNLLKHQKDIDIFRI